MAAAHTNDKQGRRYKVYFIIAWVLFFLMAMLWSIDPSFIYIFCGAALIFLILGFLNQPKVFAERARPSFKGSGSSSYQVPQTRAGLTDLLENIRSAAKKSSTTSSPQQQGRRFAQGIIFFILAMFLITIVPVLFSESQEVSEEVADYYQRAEQFRLNGEYDSADTYYRLAIDKNPEYPAALTGYGHVWLAREKYDLAMAEFEKALIIDPTYDDARYGKALTYHYQKNYKRSLQVTRGIINDNPEYFDAILLSGDNYYMQQRYDSAMIFYEDLYERGQKSAGLSHVMAYIYDTKGEYEKAIQLYKETLGYDSTRIEVYNRLSEFYPGADGNFYRNKAIQLKSEGY